MNRTCSLFLLPLAGLLPAALLIGQTAAPEIPSVMRVHAEPPGKLPTGVILVKGAEPSASDHQTPLPEEGVVGKESYENRYFGLSYPIPADWTEEVQGPPPSDSGSYVLASLVPSTKISKSVKGSILITAQDLFFNLAPATNAMEMVRYTRDHLQQSMQVDRPPAEVMIGGHPFVRLDYSAPIAGLHWAVLATEIRCHTVQFIFTGREPSTMESLIQDLGRMKLPADASASSAAGGGDVPRCIANYATSDTIIERTDPILTSHKYNPIPVRITIDRNGRVRHVHLLSAFPDQSALITEALMKWRFKPYVVNGQPEEVETGIIFGNPPRRIPPATAATGGRSSN